MHKLALILAASGAALVAAPSALAFSNSDVVGEYSCTARSLGMDMETTMDLTLSLNGKAKAEGVMTIVDPSYEMTFDFTYDYGFNIAGTEIEETDISIKVENGMFNGEPLPEEIEKDFQEEMATMEDTSSTLIYAENGILIYRGSDDVTTCIAYQG